ncbi:MAG TPA: TonB-dependent receptor [Vicinamibacterales bacterium]|nr:TonB-dependent receptor [Vicinamibacterales bacterium]
MQPKTEALTHPSPRRLPRAWIAVALVAGVTLIAPAITSGQAVTGTLLGNITDASGGTVPGATVTATEVKTNTSRTVVSNETGYYIFSSLQNGTYEVSAELQGFRKVIRKDVKVDVNTTVRVDLTLEVGQMSEAVTVSAESPILQTDRTDTGRILESKMVTELPLTFNRNFQGLLVTVPGATRPFRPHSQFFNSQDSLGTEINGQPRMANNTLIEGLDNNHKTGLLAVIIPSPDALETVSVSTSNYDAEFGRSGGAVTNVTIKSGTNYFKGSGFFYGNTEATSASDYFTHLKAPTKFAQGGFTIGGPIQRNRLFFFGDYQRTIDNLGYVVRATVPTMAMRNGDFSAVANGIYDPLTGAVNGSGRTPFANNQIPQNRISPIARRLLAFIPEPNITGAPLGQNNYQKAQVREKTTDAFDTKINYTLSDKNQIAYRISFQRPVVFDPGPYNEYGGPANDGFAGTGTNKSLSTAANWTRVFSSTLVMDVRGGVNYYHNIATAQGAGLTTSADVGIPGANLDDFTSGLSRITIGGYTAPVLGFSPSLPWDRSETTWSVATTVTKLLRNHTVKLGGEWRHNRDMLLQTQDVGGSRGLFNFNASGTGVPTDTASLSGVANSFASFLLDWPNGVTRDLKVIDEPGTQHAATFLFVHDKWQARHNVTVDLGLRWEYYTPLQGLEGPGSLSNYDPSANTLRVSGYGDTSDAVNVKNTFTNFSPRTGVSWRLNDLTVVRAGYGASTIPFPDNRYAFNYPVKQNYAGTAANGFQNAGSMAAGFPAPVLVDIPATGIIPVSGSLLNSTFDVIPPGLREGTLHSWNVAFQRQLPYQLTADIAYVGNRGVNLVMDVDENASLVYGAGNGGRPQFATFNRTGTTRVRSNDNKSEYNALQIKVDRRFRNGFMVTNSYTLSRSKDLANENGGIGTPIDRDFSWARSNFDRTHNYVLTAIYELPWGPGQRWMSESLMGKIVGGWQLSGLFVAQSGTPLTITGNGTLFNTPGNTAFANLNGENTVLGGLGPGTLYFDPSVYSLPPAGVQGNMKRNSGPEGPGFWQLDGSLFKRFSIGESRFAEFRIDAFNVTNSVRWGNPGTGFSTAAGNTFGQITGTNGSQRSLRFGGRFVF